MKRLLKRVAYWGGWMLLGPITGPLAEGVFRNWRKGERLLAGLYALAVVTTFFALPTFVALAWMFAFWVRDHAESWNAILWVLAGLLAGSVVVMVARRKRRTA